MTENPYQSPSSLDLDSISTPRHRSFRLTTGTDDACGQSSAERISDSVRFALIQQLPALIFTSMILDGGVLFKSAAIAAIAFWVGAAIVLLRQGAGCQESDALLIKWGYLPTCLITYNAWQIIGRIV